jgi:anaerobic glycerol-3-phosphate dehydrogenase
MTDYNKNSASFYLKTYDLPLLQGTNNVGSLNNAQRSSMTWKNVDIQSIMGNLWDKYKYFSITLVSALASSIVFIPGGSSNILGIINLQGLQFINSSYSTKLKCNIPTVPVGFVNFKNTNQGTFTTNKSNSGVMFQKGNPIVDLTLTLNSVVDGTLLTAFLFTNGGGTLDGMNPQQIFTFRIEGIE